MESSLSQSDKGKAKTPVCNADWRLAEDVMARGGREKASQRLNPSRKTIIICPTFVRYVMQEIDLMNPDLGASLDYEIFSRMPS